MVRVKTGTTRRARHHKVLKRAKGYRGAASRRFGRATEALLAAGRHAYRDRRARRRSFRRLWIARLGAALRAEGHGYAAFQSVLNKSGCRLNRKMLSEIAVRDPATFSRIVADLTGAK